MISYIAKMKTIVIVAALVCISFAQASKILISAPSGSKSSKNAYVPLTKELVKRGHDVTVICNYPTADFKNLKLVHEIVLPQLQPDLSAFPNQFQFALGNVSVLDRLSLIQNFLSNSTLPEKTALVTFGDPRIQNLLESSHFDLVYTHLGDRYVSLPLAWHFQAPLIGFSPNVLPPGIATILGDSEHTEYVPLISSMYSDEMNLMQRAINTASVTYLQYADAAARSGVEEIVIKKYLPNCPAIKELEDNINLVFTNSHPSFTYPRTLSPEVIEIGAIQCVTPKILPVEVEQFISGSKHGFILFSIGLVSTMDEMPEQLIQAFIKTFSLLPQRVIWHWKGQAFRRPDQRGAALPKNIKTVRFLPQQDLLGHKSCRLFLTHGGLNSLQEAIYHGVPVLGLPFGSEQQMHMIRAIEDGYALKVDWSDVSEETLSKAINSLLHEPSYLDAVKTRSLLLRDQMQTPLERAVFWTEFVIRNNGTQHLRLGSRQLSLYQRSLVDVYMLFAVLALLPIALLFFCLKRYCCCCCKSKRQADEDLPKKLQ